MIESSAKHVNIDYYSTNCIKEKGFSEASFNNSYFITVDDYVKNNNQVDGIKPPQPSMRDMGVLSGCFDELTAYFPENSVVYPLDYGLNGITYATYRKHMGGMIPDDELLEAYKATQSSKNIKSTIHQTYFGTHPNTSYSNRNTSLLKGQWLIEGGTSSTLVRNILSDTRAIKLVPSGTTRISHDVHLDEGDYCFSFYTHMQDGNKGKLVSYEVKLDGAPLSIVPFTSLKREESSFIIDGYWSDFAVKFHAPRKASYSIVLSIEAPSRASVCLAGILLEKGVKPSMYCDRQPSKDSLIYPAIFDFNIVKERAIQDNWTIAYKRFLRQDRSSATHLDAIGQIHYGFKNGSVVLGSSEKAMPTGYDPFCKWEYVVIQHDKASRTLQFCSVGKGWNMDMGKVVYDDISLLTDTFEGIEFNLGLGSYSNNGSTVIDGGTFKDLIFYMGIVPIGHVKNAFFSVTADNDGITHIRSANFKEDL